MYVCEIRGYINVRFMYGTRGYINVPFDNESTGAAIYRGVTLLIILSNVIIITTLHLLHMYACIILHNKHRENNLLLLVLYHVYLISCVIFLRFKCCKSSYKGYSPNCAVYLKSYTLLPHLYYKYEFAKSWASR